MIVDFDSNLHRIMIIARDEALRSNIRRAKVSALLMDKKMRVIYGRSHNRAFHGSRQKFSIHAEEGLLSRWYKSVLDKVILVYRAKKDGIGISKPCDKCMQIINDSGIRTIYYFDNNSNLIMKSIGANYG